MFPNEDPDKDYYEEFKNMYGREDNTIFLSYTNDNIFSSEIITNIKVGEKITFENKKISQKKGKS